MCRLEGTTVGCYFILRYTRWPSVESPLLLSVIYRAPGTLRPHCPLL
jgi:hypothetical protein